MPPPDHNKGLGKDRKNKQQIAHVIARSDPSHGASRVWEPAEHRTQGCDLMVLRVAGHGLQRQTPLAIPPSNSMAFCAPPPHRQHRQGASEFATAVSQGKTQTQNKVADIQLESNAEPAEANCPPILHVLTALLFTVIGQCQVPLPQRCQVPLFISVRLPWEPKTS